MLSSQTLQKPSANRMLVRIWSKLRSNYLEPCPVIDGDALTQEHGILLRHYGTLQRRCSEQAQAQADELNRLRKEIALLRIQLRESDLALAAERAANGNLVHARGGLGHRGEALCADAASVSVGSAWSSSNSAYSPRSPA